MTESEWAAIAAMITTAWPSSRWPEETQALYRAKFDACNPRELASVIDSLTESSEFLPAIATILKEFKRRHPAKSGLNGSHVTFGTLEYFQWHYGDERGVQEHREFLEYRERRQLEDKQRSGAKGPRPIDPGEEARRVGGAG